VIQDLIPLPDQHDGARHVARGRDGLHGVVDGGEIMGLGVSDRGEQEDQRGE
jgi:hypothetical protein